MGISSTLRVEPDVGNATAFRPSLTVVANNPGSPQPPSERFREALSRDGFVAMAGAEIGPAALMRRAVRDLQAATPNLPADPYCAGGYRYRRYARLYMLPWTELLTPAPTEWEGERSYPVFTYQQPADLNSEAEGVARRFAAVEPAMLGSEWLEHIIRFDFAQLRFTETEMQGPIQVGVHIVDLRPRPGVPAVASPNRVHRDGEHYTCAHLIERHDVLGGENHIVDPEWADHEIADVPASAIRSAFTLENPLDSYIVRDDRVAHHVEGVSLADGAAQGARTILLIDFTPMQPYVLLKPAA